MKLCDLNVKDNVFINVEEDIEI